ncbi:hypothetical protein KIL84_010686 [Mauremys mutica]|uniref:Uncharacterized protein n=1 Tax=Mauremys mutica TaxID=74926 RepID=A0A9D4B173_9SAUR|nr:hypothetical protein KIL84_010686 [Mauremys mutica]
MAQMGQRLRLVTPSLPFLLETYGSLRNKITLTELNRQRCGAKVHVRSQKQDKDLNVETYKSKNLPLVRTTSHALIKETFLLLLHYTAFESCRNFVVSLCQPFLLKKEEIISIYSVCVGLVKHVY